MLLLCVGVTHGVYLQAGRPRRLSVDEAKLLESQWQDFGEYEGRGHSAFASEAVTHYAVLIHSIERHMPLHLPLEGNW